LINALKQMMKRGILAKRKDVSEVAGKLDVICTEKSGILTTNDLMICLFIVENEIINLLQYP